MEGLPIITKSPTDETVVPGGSCSFVAAYQNALYAVWHFVSPDGQTDLSYEEIGTKFPALQVVNGMGNAMELYNIPEDMNGWRVYCCYSNDVGTSNTETAGITVKKGTGTTASQGLTSANYPGLYTETYGSMGTMEITDQSGWYSITVTWPQDSYEIRMWEFAGNFDANGVLYYDNCVSTLFEFDEQGNETPIILFSGGSGKLEYNASNGGILWTSDNDLDVFDFSKT